MTKKLIICHRILFFKPLIFKTQINDPSRTFSLKNKRSTTLQRKFQFEERKNEKEKFIYRNI